MNACYATLDDMRARFGQDCLIQLSDQQGIGQIDAATVQVALDDATAEINGYLGRYPLPFKTVPPVLTRLCCDIARYRLCSNGAAVMTDDILNKYRIDTLNMLKSIANGLVTLGIQTDGAQVATGDVVEFAPAATRVFGRARA